MKDICVPGTTRQALDQQLSTPSVLTPSRKHVEKWGAEVSGVVKTQGSSGAG